MASIGLVWLYLLSPQTVSLDPLPNPYCTTQNSHRLTSQALKNRLLVG